MRKQFSAAAFVALALGAAHAAEPIEGLGVVKFGMTKQEVLKALSPDGKCIFTDFGDWLNEEGDECKSRKILNNKYEIEYLVQPLGGIKPTLKFEGQKLVAIDIFFDDYFYRDAVMTFTPALIAEKYGPPVRKDTTKPGVCQNRIGGKFNSTVGVISDTWQDSTGLITYRKEFGFDNRCGPQVIYRVNFHDIKWHRAKVAAEAKAEADKAAQAKKKAAGAL